MEFARLWRDTDFVLQYPKGQDKTHFSGIVFFSLLTTKEMYH